MALYDGGRIEDYYILGRYLRRGEYGTIYLCTQISTNLEYACKCISKSKIRSVDKEFSTVAQEIEIMYHLSGHPNIMTLKNVFEDASNVYLVMEFCKGGDLLDRINQQRTFTEAKAAHVMQTIIGVVKACHEKGVVHLDLKPENILFQTTQEDAVIKCIDFGCSQFFEPDKALKAVVGTPYYVAPEVLKRCYGKEADIWSAGVILYVMLSGVPPFWAETTEGILEEIRKEKPPSFVDDPWQNISEDAKDLIRRMLDRDPRKRPRASDVLKHRWIVTYNDEARKNARREKNDRTSFTSYCCFKRKKKNTLLDEPET